MNAALSLIVKLSILIQEDYAEGIDVDRNCDSVYLGSWK